ncbi:MAG: YciI family protein [Actinomycetota bacterium]|nr:YciI family protein [Actinomycetota bacterium]
MSATQKESNAMANYVYSFRGDPNRQGSPDQEAAWGRWLGEIGANIVDAGNRVGRSTRLGAGGADPATVLGGYIVISADDFDAAVNLAKGCPGLAHGGAIEVGETVPAS